MERITREDLNMNIALLISKRATCVRAQVGAVITRDGRIISTGYNGPIKNEPHCNPKDCDVSKSCTRAVHAEANAIYNATKQGTSLDGAELYCTYRPCQKCFEAIVQSGITTVYYLWEYKTDMQKEHEVKYHYQLNGVKLVKLEYFKIQVYNGE